MVFNVLSNLPLRTKCLFSLHVEDRALHDVSDLSKVISLVHVPTKDQTESFHGLIGKVSTGNALASSAGVDAHLVVDRLLHGFHYIIKETGVNGP